MKKILVIGALVGAFFLLQSPQVQAGGSGAGQILLLGGERPQEVTLNGGTKKSGVTQILPDVNIFEAEIPTPTFMTSGAGTGAGTGTARGYSGSALERDVGERMVSTKLGAIPEAQLYPTTKKEKFKEPSPNLFERTTNLIDTSMGAISSWFGGWGF